MRKFSQLLRIDNNRKITKEDWEFLHHLQKALLLALEERGTLNIGQYRQAEKQLDRQQQKRARELIQKGRGDPSSG